MGKSSLINRLLGRDAQAVGALARTMSAAGTRRRARQLIELPEGGVLIDTPGLRELGLLDDAGGVETSFADVAAFAERCRFRDCAHAGEPGCAVEAAGRGKRRAAGRASRELSQAELRELAAAERARDPVLASRTKARWKEIHRAMRARSKVDPKLKR